MKYQELLTLVVVVVIAYGRAEGDVSSVISSTLFDEILKHRDDPKCPANGFYTYEAFISAAQFFQGFGTTGDSDTRKREIAAFLAQSSFETTGGWATAPDGPYSWGYCFIEEQGNPPDYCVASAQWPCAPGKKYYGRGPIQISYNYNYGPAGRAIGSDLLNNPDTVTTDPIISFKTALWYWMTPQAPKPSCHDVITGKWTPSDAESEAGMVPGYGVITNIINGGNECGKGSNQRVESRIGFYKRYCDIFGVDYGNSLDCFHQRIDDAQCIFFMHHLSNVMKTFVNQICRPVVLRVGPSYAQMVPSVSQIRLILFQALCKRRLVLVMEYWKAGGA